MSLLCYNCHKIFTSLSNMLYHLKRVHAVYPHNDVPCGQNDCPKICSSFRYLRYHIKTHHSDLLSSTESSLSNVCQEANEIAVDKTSFMDVDVASASDLELVNNTLQFSIQENIQGSFIGFISKLQARSNVLLANVKFVTENVQELLHDSSNYITRRLHSVFKEVGIDDSSAAIQELYHDIESIATSINNVDTEHKQLVYLKKNHFYIEPKPIPVGDREDSHRSSASNEREITNVIDTAQYVPIEVLLARIIVECDNRSLSIVCHTHADRDGNLTDFYDTETYKKHPFFSQFPDALVLHFYIDGFETTNPLGPHTQIHKMEGLYMMIRNLPSKLLAKETSIFLVGMWYAQDAKDKERTYDVILAPLVRKLKELESNDGVDVNICGQTVKVRAALALFSADNLGYHSLFGFLESFTARKFCRLCEATKDDSQQKFFESDYVQRTRNSYDQCVQLIGQPGYSESNTGIKHGCIFNQLKYFHVMENYAVDAMHDLLEGIVPIELSDILGSLTNDGYFDLDEFNLLLTRFNFSSSDYNSRPTTFSSFKNMKMTASECWCIIRNIPYIIGHKIPRDEPHWNLLLLLLEIMGIVLAPKVNTDLAHYLSQLIAEHHQTYLKLFPEKRLTPKHHYLVHYPTALIKCGPPCRYWCMRFESQHNFFKQISRATHCYKNIAYSLTKRGQLALANAFLSHSVFNFGYVTGTTKEEYVGFLESDGIQHLLRDKFNLPLNETIHVAKWIEVGHYKIANKNVVVCGLPEFGCVECIVCFGGNTYLILKKYSVYYYNDHFNGYVVEYNTKSNFFCMQVHELKDHIPLDIHKVLFEGKMTHFVSPRYIIF